MTHNLSESGVTFHFRWKTSRRFPGIPWKKEKRKEKTRNETRFHLTNISALDVCPVSELIDCRRLLQSEVSLHHLWLSLHI